MSDRKRGGQTDLPPFTELFPRLVRTRSEGGLHHPLEKCRENEGRRRRKGGRETNGEKRRY